MTSWWSPKIERACAATERAATWKTVLVSSPGDLVHVRDHQQEALRRREGRRQGAGLQRAVHGARSAALRLHFDDCRNRAPEVLLSLGGPLIRELAHVGGGRDRIDGDHLVHSVGDGGRGLVAVNRDDRVFHVRLTPWEAGARPPRFSPEVKSIPRNMAVVSYLWHYSPCGLSQFGQNWAEFMIRREVIRLTAGRYSAVGSGSQVGTETDRARNKAASDFASGIWPLSAMRMASRTGMRSTSRNSSHRSGSGSGRRSVARNTAMNSVEYPGARKNSPTFFQRACSHAGFFPHLTRRAGLIGLIPITRARGEFKQIGRLPHAGTGARRAGCPSHRSAP